MKGVVFWFSLFSPEKKKKMTPSSLSSYFILFPCHKCSRWIVGELTFNSLTKSPSKTLFIFIMFSYYQLSLFQNPPQLSAQHGGNAPWLLHCVIINSVAFLEVPHNDPSSSSWRTSRPCRQGLCKWKRKSLPYPTAPLCCLISTWVSFKPLPDSSTKLQTRARATFYNFFVSSGSVLKWKQDNIPQRFSSSNTTVKTLQALSQFKTYCVIRYWEKQAEFTTEHCRAW